MVLTRSRRKADFLSGSLEDPLYSVLSAFCHRKKADSAKVQMKGLRHE